MSAEEKQQNKENQVERIQCIVQFDYRIFRVSASCESWPVKPFLAGSYQFRAGTAAFVDSK